MIDKRLHNELRQRYNPDGSKMREVQLRMLEMLKFIDNVCSENDITYWLSSGTCLGAMRHGGFIPWDDDVDVEMLEQDYRKFVDVMTNLPQTEYVMQTYKTDRSFFAQFGKLRDTHSRIKETYSTDHRHKFQGLFIDIFPMRPSSSDLIHRCGYYPLLLVSFGAPKLYLNRATTSAVQIIGHLCISITRFILNGLQKIGKKKYLRHTSPNYFSLPRVKEEILPTKRMLFEGIELCVPRDTDNYLKRLYGPKYMEIPPTDKIKKHLTAVDLMVQ